MNYEGISVEVIKKKLGKIMTRICLIYYTLYNIRTDCILTTYRLGTVLR